MRGLSAVLLLPLLLAFGCGGSGGDGDEGGGGGATITMSATEFEFEPARVRLESAGTYTFEVANEGETVHALEVEGEGLEEETDEIQPGETGRLTVELAEGEYELYCPVGDHKDRGMDGTLTVGGGASGGTTGTTDDEADTAEDDGGGGSPGY